MSYHLFLVDFDQIKALCAEKNTGQTPKSLQSHRWLEKKQKEQQLKYDLFTKMSLVHACS